MIEKLLKKDEIISHLNVREYLNNAIVRESKNLPIVLIFVIWFSTLI